MVGSPDFSSAVSDPTDDALRDSNVDYAASEGNVIAAGGDGNAFNQGHDSGSTDYLLNVSAVITSGNAGAVADEVTAHIQVFNAAVDQINEIYLPVHSGGKFFPHGFPIPDGGTFKMTVRNDSAEEITYDAAYGYRTE